MRHRCQFEDQPACQGKAIGKIVNGFEDNTRACKKHLKLIEHEGGEVEYDTVQERIREDRTTTMHQIFSFA